MRTKPLGAGLFMAAECSVCGEAFPSRTQLFKHLRTKQADGSLSACNTAAAEDGMVLTAPPPDKRRPEAQRMEAQRVKAQRVEAQRVEAQRVEARRVEAHYQRVEARRVEAQRVEARRVEVQRCSVCGEAFPSRTQLFKHLRTKQADGSLSACNTAAAEDGMVLTAPPPDKRRPEAPNVAPPPPAPPPQDPPVLPLLIIGTLKAFAFFIALCMDVSNARKPVTPTCGPSLCFEAGTYWSLVALFYHSAIVGSILLLILVSCIPKGLCDQFAQNCVISLLVVFWALGSLFGWVWIIFGLGSGEFQASGIGFGVCVAWLVYKVFELVMFCRICQYEKADTPEGSAVDTHGVEERARTWS